MKHFSKKLSWLLAFVLFFTNIVFTGIPVYAADTTPILDEGTNAVFADGTYVRCENYKSICYYESKDSDTVVYEYKDSPWGGSIYIGNEYIAIKPYAWHIKYIETKIDNLSSSESVTRSYFKAYPVTTLEDIPVNTTMTFPEGTTLTTTGSAINVSIYVGTTELKYYSIASSEYKLPSASDLRSDVGETTFNSALTTSVYNLPDLTKLYYTVELTDKSTTPYSLKLTLVPTVEVTFDENTGTINSGEKKMYAIPKAIIDTSKFPTVSKDGFDFYDWKIGSGYIEKNNPTVSSASVFKSMYKERIPTFKLDLDNKKVTNLLPNRTYAYSPWDNTVADANGEIVNYDQINDFVFYARLRLIPENTNVSVASDFVSLQHVIPPLVVEYTETTARVTNKDEFTGLKIKLTGGSSTSDWVEFSEFPELLTGLTTGTSYTISVKHEADEYGFEYTRYATFRASKAVSNESSKGVTIADIPDQTHTGSYIVPSLTITDGEETLVQGTYYTVYYSNNVNVGTATATVNFLSKYSGSMTKTFNIVNYKVISFAGNGGTGTMANVSVPNGEQYTLPACAFVAPSNKEFKAWDIGGTEYTPGTNYTVTDNTTVTAIWKDKVAIPIISPNGSTFSSSQTVTITCETADSTIYYTTNGTTPTTSSTVYSGPFTISSSITVKAIAVKGGMANSGIASASFTKLSSNSGGSTAPTHTAPTYTAPTYTIKFDTDDGSTVESKDIKEGSTIGEIPEPTKEGYVFEGWYSDKEQTKAYDANTKITASTTLYAKWSKVETKPADNSKKELVLTIGKKEAKAFGSDKTNDVAPIIRNDRTMLPARFIAESLGAEVLWNGKKREVTVKGKNEKGEDVTILIYIDSYFAYVNGKKVMLESPAFIENDRTYTPIRFIAEKLGAMVEWIEAEQKVVITKKGD